MKTKSEHEGHEAKHKRPRTKLTLSVTSSLAFVTFVFAVPG